MNSAATPDPDLEAGGRQGCHAGGSTLPNSPELGNSYSFNRLSRDLRRDSNDNSLNGRRSVRVVFEAHSSPISVPRRLSQSPRFPLQLDRSVSTSPSLGRRRRYSNPSSHITTPSTLRRSVSAAPIDIMTSSASQRAGASPSSSPRLPSPPPLTEVQFGPLSPSVGAGVSELSLDPFGGQDEGASRRIRPGTKAVDMARGPPFIPLHQVESPFQLQEYLSALYHKLTREEGSKTVQPVTKEIAMEIASPPTAQDTGEAVDRNLWLYELCRFLCNKTTRIIVGFFTDNPPCSNQTCPEMRASEWQYLCAVHEPPKSCCAIDYCNHTLDWASNVLTSTKHFPSRLSLGGETGNAFQSMRQLTNIFRRVYRIYAHAWFQHREVFWTIEAELGLYILFKTVCDVYQLIPEDSYTIPPEAEGERVEIDDNPVNTTSQEFNNKISILRKDGEPQTGTSPPDTQARTSVATAATTRRHKHTPSTGAPVPVIAEGQEEDDDEDSTQKPVQSLSASSEQSSLSPPKPQRERAKSPGRITLPRNDSPERAPEDPTPVADYTTSPFGGPLVAVERVTKVEPQKESEEPVTLTDGTAEATTESLGDQTIIFAPADVEDTQTMNADVANISLEPAQDVGEPTSLEKDAQTQTVSEHENETMEKIEIEHAKDVSSESQSSDEITSESDQKTPDSSDDERLAHAGGEKVGNQAVPDSQSIGETTSAVTIADDKTVNDKNEEEKTSTEEKSAPTINDTVDDSTTASSTTDTATTSS